MVAVSAITAPALGLASLLAPARLGSPGSVRVAGEELEVTSGGSSRRVPLAEIRGGAILPDAATARVELELEGGDVIYADLPTIAEGERLLAAAGLDSARRCCTFRLGSPSWNVLKVAGSILGMFAVLGAIVGKGHAPLDPIWIPPPPDLLIAPSCSDAATLQRWLLAAISATSAEQLFSA